MLQDADVRGEQISLVLLDFNLTSQPDAPVRGVLTDQNGFDILDVIDRAERSPLPRKDFCFRPLVAMVSGYANELVNLDETINDCDVLLPKPLTAYRARVLVETSLV